jgi:hypothetical protein
MTELSAPSADQPQRCSLGPHEEWDYVILLLCFDEWIQAASPEMAVQQSMTWRRTDS